MTSAIALAAAAARAGLVSVTLTVTMLMGAIAVLAAAAARLIETPARRRLRRFAEADLRDDLGERALGHADHMAARGSVLSAVIGAPLASVGWPR